MSEKSRPFSKKKGILVTVIAISLIISAVYIYQNNQKPESQKTPSQLDTQIIQKALPQVEQNKQSQSGMELTTTSVSLSWTSPTGSVTTDYSIQYSTDNTNWANWSHSPSPSTSQTVTGLSSNTA